MMRIDLEEYVRKADLPPGEQRNRFREMLGNEWDASQGLFERDGLGRLVGNEAIRRTLVGMKLEPAEYAPALEAVARRISEDPMFGRLWEHCWHLAYRSEPLDRWSAERWQPFERFLGENAREFFLSVLLSHYDCLMEFVKARSIPMEIVAATLVPISNQVREDTARAGQPGIGSSGLTWFISHLAGKIFRLGRLMYMPRPFEGKLALYRNRNDGKMLALPNPGLRFRRDGQIDGAGSQSDPEGAWMTELHEHGSTLAGNAWISPHGYARHENISLDLTVWEAVLEHGDQTLEFHIPGGEPLDHTACGESFSRSLEFFAEHFPEITPRAIYTGSWLLDPQLQGMLPATANLVRFQREMYLYPVDYDAGGERHVLGADYNSLDDAPQRTALQRAVVKHLGADGHMMPTGGILLADDVAGGCWGTQRYINAAGP